MAENNEKKRGISEKEVLNWVRELVEDCEIDGADEVLEKLDKMIEARSKTREYKPDEAKIAKGNEFAAMWTGDTFKASDVKLALGLDNAQKANGICSVMVNTGAWEVVPSVETVRVYKVKQQ